MPTCTWRFIAATRTTCCRASPTPAPPSWPTNAAPRTSSWPSSAGSGPRSARSRLTSADLGGSDRSGPIWVRDRSIQVEIGPMQVEICRSAWIGSIWADPGRDHGRVRPVVRRLHDAARLRAGDARHRPSLPRLPRRHRQPARDDALQLPAHDQSVVLHQRRRRTRMQPPLQVPAPLLLLLLLLLFYDKA